MNIFIGGGYGGLGGRLTRLLLGDGAQVSVGGRRAAPGPGFHLPLRRRSLAAGRQAKAANCVVLSGVSSLPAIASCAVHGGPIVRSLGARLARCRRRRRVRPAATPRAFGRSAPNESSMTIGDDRGRSGAIRSVAGCRFWRRSVSATRRRQRRREKSGGWTARAEPAPNRRHCLMRRIGACSEASQPGWPGSKRWCDGPCR